MADTQSPVPRNYRRCALTSALELLLFVGLALYAVWPLAREFRTSLPQATESVATVPLFNLWTLWWNADRAAHRYSGYWDSPIFFPTQGTFAFSEPQPTSIVVAPLVWLSAAPVSAYNAYLVLSLALNGWAGSQLVRQVTGNRWTGLAGGAMLLLLPFVHWQLGVLQLVPLWGVLWTIGALRSFGTEPRVSRGLSLGAALGATYLSCAYHGLFLILLLLGAGWWLIGRNLRDWRTFPRLVPGMLLCLGLVFPVLHKQREIIRTYEFTRTADIIKTLSADLGDYSVTPWAQWLQLGDFADPERRPYWHLGPGSIKLLLAAAGVVIGLIDRRLRLWTAFAVTFTALAVLLSLGLRFRIGAWIPYQLLIDWFPGMAQVRNVFRFALFAQLMTALLAAQGLEVLSPYCWRGLGDKWRRRGTQPDAKSEGKAVVAAIPPVGRLASVAGAVAVLVAGGIAALEVCPPSQNLFRLPPPEENSGWISWLRENTAQEAVIACVPFPPGITVDDYQDTTLWMYWGTIHSRRMVNGYSGFFPPPFMDLKQKMDFFPDPASLGELEALGVQYCVVRRKSINPAAWGRIFAYPARLKPLFWDEKADVGIFELPAGGHEALDE